MQYIYSDTFTQTITSAYGAKGVQWLTDLPTIIEQCVEQWSLTNLNPYETLTYNYVLSGMMHNVPIVLKLRCDPIALEKEVAALHAFENHGCIKIIAHNALLGAVLLEQVMPGKSLSTLVDHQDELATRIAADCIRKLHQATIPTRFLFPTLEQTLPDFTLETKELMPFIAQARTLRKQLLASPQEKVFLHGDFHHGNILSSSNKTWSVIDPEGIIGDPVYDLAVYIRNPLTKLLDAPDAQTIIVNRIHQFANLLGYNPQHIYDWTYLQTVSSTYWSIEDGLDISRHIAFLTLLRKIEI